MLSHTRSNIAIGITAVAGLLLATEADAAQSAQDQKLHVQAVIGDLCTVTAASLDFGPGYDGVTAVDATGSIDISCVAPTTLGVQLDGGHNPGGGAGNRAMTGPGGGNNLLYVLYKNAPGDTPWETGGQVSTTITGTGSVPVYGRIPGQGNGHTPGVHTDDVTITLNF